MTAISGKQAVFKTGVNNVTLNVWAREGRVVADKDPHDGRWIFDEDDLMEYRNSHLDNLRATGRGSLADMIEDRSDR